MNSVVAPIVEITKWRIREFLREPEALFWIFAFPLILAIALGVAFKERGQRPVKVLVEDGRGAQQLADKLNAAQDLEAEVTAGDAARAALRQGRVSLVVVPGNPVAFRFDSTREESLLARLVTADALQRSEGRRDVREIREIGVTEPGGRYIDFLIPGLLGMNIMGTGIWGVGFGIVQTRSRKLLKRFVASPMRKAHFLLGHMCARLAFLVFEVGVLLLFGHVAFGVPFRGSIPAVAVIVLVGALTFAGIGVLVAARPRTVEGVSGLMNLVMVPMWIGSGVFFSASRFPDAVQPMINAIPLTALNDALRSVILDGAPLVDTAGWLLVMAAWAAGAFVVALKIFRWT